MTKTKKGKLQFFSLEIQFGDVEFNENFDNPRSNGVVSVRAKFMNYPSIEIHENEFCNSCGTEEVFNNGKHFLISIEDKGIERLQKEFIINLKVMMTSHAPDLLPIVQPVGFSRVNIARSFATLFSQMGPKSTKECPKVKLYSDQLEIIDPALRSIIGTINIYLRLRAFGKCLIRDMEEFKVNFDECVDIKPDADEPASGRVQERLTLENNEFQDLNVTSKDVGVRVKVSQPVYKMKPPQKEEKKPVPGTICMGKEQIVFLAPKPNTNKLEEERSKFTYDMKTGIVPPPDDQLIHVIPDSFMPKPDERPLDKGPLPTIETEEEGEDVYGFYMKKVNLEKNLYSTAEWDVKIPKLVSKDRDRHTRDVQYHLMDLVKK